MTEQPNTSRLGMQAQGGATRLTRSFLKPPDTIVKLPNGENLILCVDAAELHTAASNMPQFCAHGLGFVGCMRETHMHAYTHAYTASVGCLFSTTRCTGRVQGLRRPLPSSVSTTHARSSPSQGARMAAANPPSSGHAPCPSASFFCWVSFCTRR